MSQIFTTSSVTPGTNIAAAGFHDFIFIAEGVTRGSTDLLADAVTSDGFSAVQVHVLGSVVAGGDGATGLDLAAKDRAFNADALGLHNVTVGAAGSVTGGLYGMTLFGARNSVDNQGEVTGRTWGIASLGDRFQLTNSGTITGHESDGVVVGAVFIDYSAPASPDIVNHGLIQSLGKNGSANAVDMRGAAPGVAKLANYGTLSAASGIAVTGDDDGVDKVSNFGLIHGDVLQLGGDDVFRNGGHVNGDVDLGNGSDLFKGKGGEVEGLILGNAGNDTIGSGLSDNLINGGDGNDQLSGGSGDDTLLGGLGADRTRGGGGEDTFRFKSVMESGPAFADRDTITAFQKGEDLIQLAAIDADTGVAGNQAFTFIGSSAFSAPGQVRVEQRGGNTLVEASTDNDAAQMAFTLLGLHTLAAGDFIL